MDIPARQVYANHHVRPAEQFAYWRESICEVFAALDPVAPTAAASAFPSLVTVDPLPGGSLSLVQSQAQRVVRAAPQIRRDPCDRLFVNLMLDGQGVVEQDGRRSRVGPGELYLVDTRRPYVLEHPEPFRLLSLAVPPERLLPGAAGRLACAAVRTPALGRVRLAAALLRQLHDEADALDLVARGEAMDAACRWLAGALGPDDDRSPDAAARASQRGLEDTWRRAGRVIAARLREPALAPADIAAELRVSLRYLHKAFAAQGTSVAATVRSQRLAACALALLQSGGHRTVAAIAADWGWLDTPNFHRQFRRHYGHTPGEHRLRMLGRADH